MRQTDRWLLLAIVGMVVVFALFVWLLLGLGVVSFAGDEADGDIGSAVALVGGLFTSLLTGVGIFMRLAFEQRTEDRLRIESERSARRARQEKKRLRVETAIKAVGLMSTASGADASPSQKASALILLADLGQLEFALTQLAALWPREEVPPAAAVWLVDAGLRATGRKAHLQGLAAGILLHNHDKLFIGADGNFEFPESWHLRWDTGLATYARRVGLEVLILLLLAKRPWKRWHPPYLNHVFVMFRLIMREEGADAENGKGYLEAAAALAAGLLLRVVATIGMGLYTPEGSRSFDELRADIDAVVTRLGGAEATSSRCTIRLQQLLEQLGSWVDDASPPGDESPSASTALS